MIGKQPKMQKLKFVLMSVDKLDWKIENNFLDIFIFYEAYVTEENICLFGYADKPVRLI